MKKVLSLVLALCLGLSSMAGAFAAPAALAAWDSAPLDSGWVELTPEEGSQLELKGTVQPAVISVVMPSRIPFDISRSLPTENKVVSPRLSFTNHSTIPVVVVLDNVEVDLSRMPGTVWGSSRYAGYNEIAVGLSNSNTRPNTLDSVTWLTQGKQDVGLLYLYPGVSGSVYVAGALGYGVPENQSFTVTTTLVVRRY